LPDTNDAYLGCKFKDNYVYGAAINLMWNDLKQNITGEDVALMTDNKPVIHFVRIMNTFPFSKDDLDSESYYVRSGFGQKTEDLINDEVKLKYPDKSFPPLDIKLASMDFISYAYIYKNIKFQISFAPGTRGFYFDTQSVKGFWAETIKQKKNVAVVHYWNSLKFIIKLKLKDTSDELFIAKGFDQTNPKEVMTELGQNDVSNGEPLKDDDIFGMPELHFDDTHNFNDLMNLAFLNKRILGYRIIKAGEKLKFDLDFNGVRLENEAAMAGAGGMPNRKMVLNKPFWLIMKKRQSSHPYFILGVNNTEVMEKIANGAK